MAMAVVVPPALAVAVTTVAVATEAVAADVGGCRWAVSCAVVVMVLLADTTSPLAASWGRCIVGGGGNVAAKYVR